jgi:hypothetical protein
MSAATVQTLGQEAVDVDKADDDDLVMWSVTTIINVLERSALLYWSAEESARAAINQQATWRGMLADCDTDCKHTSARDCAAVKWLRDARFRRPKDLLSSSDLGTAIHALCEEYALTGTRPDTDRIGAEVRTQGGNTVKVALEIPVLSAMLDRFDEWLNRAQPTYQATEVIVYSPTYGYAGAADAFLTVDGFRAIADYKSSREPYDAQGKPKTPYPEVAPQLAAYRYAEFAAVWRPRRTEKWRRRYYLLNESERAMAEPVPQVDGGLCIHITPESCEAYPVRCNRSMHQQFLFIQEAARFVFETSKTAIGQPLEFTGRSTS